MTWITDNERWLGQYEKLIAYKEEHGDTLVPRRKTGEDKSLGLWVDTQRKWNRTGKLRQDRKRLLEDIGFAWAAPSKCSAQQKAKNDARWMDQYQKLKACKEIHGNTLVPQKYSVDKAFGKWVDNQRSRNKQGTLREDRKQLLNEIGFVWNARKHAKPKATTAMGCSNMSWQNHDNVCVHSLFPSKKRCSVGWGNTRQWTNCENGTIMGEKDECCGLQLLSQTAGAWEPVSPVTSTEKVSLKPPAVRSADASLKLPNLSVSKPEPHGKDELSEEKKRALVDLYFI